MEPSVRAPARPGIAERLAAMIRIPTVSAEREERGDAPFTEFVDLLAELYPLLHEHLPCERIGEFGLVYTWQPADAGDADPVVLMAHYDVVPVAGQESSWAVPPFEGRIVDDEVWGRGALDDKGALCALLDAVENLLAEGWTPPRPVLLCLGPDEEVHGTTGRQIATELHARGVTPWLVLDEGGAIVDIPFPGVDGLFAMVGLAEKGVMSVELSTTGEGGHASAPNGLTAVGRLARAVSRVNRNPFDVRLPRTVSAMLAALAAARQPASRPVLPAGGEGPVADRTAAARGRKRRCGAGAHQPGPDHAVRRQQRERAAVQCDGDAQHPGHCGGDHRRRAGAAAQGDRRSRGGHPDGRRRRTHARVVVGQRTVRPDQGRRAGRLPGGGHRPVPDHRSHRRTPLAPVRAGGLPVRPAADGRRTRAGIHGNDERVSIDSLVRGERFYRAILQGLPA